MVKWYEKTVEYAFARKFLDIAAMPLSGSAEKVGDTIFYDGNAFFIIEFKKGVEFNEQGELMSMHEQIEQEKAKYVDINGFLEKISNYEAHSAHYVVFGTYHRNNKKFDLAAKTYLDFLKNDGYEWYLNTLNTYLYPTDNLTELKNYLQFLINSKKVTSKDSSSVDYSNTLIVDMNGNACSLSDRGVLQELKLNFPINKLKTPTSTFQP